MTNSFMSEKTPSRARLEGTSVPPGYMSMRAIARAMGKSPDTVSRLLEGQEPFRLIRPPKIEPLSRELKKELREILQRCREQGAGSAYCGDIGARARDAVRQLTAGKFGEHPALQERIKLLEAIAAACCHEKK